VIQIVIYLKEGQTREIKDRLAADITETVWRMLGNSAPIEVWFREYAAGRVYLGGEAI
jgi:phenylpyruvate tautomerase PptA (4-oxalocrotonate tautomerase family)